jgi:hypothetical protein
VEAPVAGWSSRGAHTKPRKARAPRLTAGRRKALVERCAAILRAGEPTCFAFEATCRHSLRAGLCLNGWSWARADADAADIVAQSLRRIGAERPAWREGQPRYTQEGFCPVERTRCAWCAKPLPAEKFLYCCTTCSQRARQVRRVRDERAYDYAVRRAHDWGQP